MEPFWDFHSSEKDTINRLENKMQYTKCHGVDTFDSGEMEKNEAG